MTHPAQVGECVRLMRLLCAEPVAVDVVVRRTVVELIDAGVLEGVVNEISLVDHGNSLLASLSATSYSDVTCALLRAGADPNAGVVPSATSIAHEEAFTPLMRASKAKFDNTRTIVALLRFGAETDGPDGRGLTPLHFAISKPLAHMELLLAAGADPLHKSHMDETPVDAARGRSFRHPQYLALLTAAAEGSAFRGALSVRPGDAPFGGGVGQFARQAILHGSSWTVCFVDTPADACARRWLQKMPGWRSFDPMASRCAGNRMMCVLDVVGAQSSAIVFDDLWEPSKTPEVAASLSEDGAVVTWSGSRAWRYGEGELVESVEFGTSNAHEASGRLSGADVDEVDEWFTESGLALPACWYKRNVGDHRFIVEGGDDALLAGAVGLCLGGD